MPEWRPEATMHRVPVELLTPGMQLGRSLYNHRGDVLLSRSTPLDSSFIQGIRQRGYRFVYVMDGVADEVEPADLVSQRLRSKTLNNLDSMFELMTEATKALRDEAAVDGAHVLHEVPVKLGGAIERQIKRLEADVDQLLAEVFDAQIFEGVAALKSHDNYTFEHS